MFRNKYDFKPVLADFLVEMLIKFNEEFFNDFDREKVKHIRNVQSNLGFMASLANNMQNSTFYIGLLDNDELIYKFTKEKAKNKVC